ncbi:hypothetical protein Thein_1925 [Thermodesulfatator indicus DSM 15286]|uniref:Uncharacterized protein n=1 Tax=Thermodesulfatator indicus (strain DSM 15286 / JCM 11887 / CIR29812) TaxID=667014 RepID=F8ACK5_THEID|nr:ParM/StbA family protein [Thermodesulfatator indicus]AEH45780.1 hypothetical protein Thein_1925 [Thermodesulfatator indicus DSM 15286]
MKVLVFDPGYGDVKCALVDTVSGEEPRLFKFPTLVARARGGLDFGEGSGEIFWAGEKWLVGEEAARAGRVVSTTTDGFLERYLPLLLVRALLESGDKEGVDEVVIAVSLHDWPRREVFERAAGRLMVNDRSYSHRVRLIPQGYGIWLETLSPWDGIVVDIGFRTVDVLVFVDGKPDGRRSFGVAGMGVVDFISEAAKILSAKARVEFSPGEVAHFLQEGNPVFRRFGVEEELKSRAGEWSARLWTSLIAKEDFSRAMALLGRVVIAGGGARFFVKPDEETAVDMQVLDEEPEFANVRGFALRLLEGGGEEE